MMVREQVCEEKDLWKVAHDQLLTAVVGWLYASCGCEKEKAYEELLRLVDVHRTLEDLIG